MLWGAVRILAVLAALYFATVLLAWRYQERLAFPAPRRRLPEPRDAGVPEAELVQVTTADGVALRGWFFPPKPGASPGRAPGLLWFYGNMETVADLADLLRAYRPPEYGLLALDYRGYGASEARRPTEAGLYRDADAAWGYLTRRPEIDAERIAVYGRSLGSVVALYVATTYPVRAVALDSPLSSAAEMARRHYWFLPPGVLRLSLDNLSRAHRLEVPLFVVHGGRDTLAPPAMARAVAEAGQAEEVLTIDGAGHNETYLIGGKRYRDRLWAFLRRHAA